MSNPTQKFAHSLWDKTDTVLNDLSYIAPEDTGMRKTKVWTQLSLATLPLVQIHALMHGKEWNVDTLDQIAAILRQAGFLIGEARP